MEIPDLYRFCPHCGSGISSESRRSGMEKGGAGSFEATTIIRKKPEADPVDGNSGAFTIGDRLTRKFEKKQARPHLKGPLLEGRYELLDEGKKGGFGIVHRARDVKLNRIVAVKKILTSRITDQQAMARFKGEAEAIASMNHRNIVMVFDREIDCEEPFIVMEYIEGGTLGDFLKSRGGKLPLSEALTLMQGVAQGLAYAHRKNLIHRDIKPANILIAEDQGTVVPKLVDFGLARMGASELSVSGYGLGTPFYMPPEQLRDAKNINHTADIYALGKVLYVVLTGEEPHNVDESLLPPAPALVEIVRKCLKTKPEERYFSVDEFIAALGRLRGNAHTDRQSGMESLNLCPTCSRSNPEEAKFCEGCGQGLVRFCPECERENRVQVQFCPGCGTDIDGFFRMEEAVERMQRHVDEARYSRVIKEFSLLPAENKNRGVRGEELWGVLRQLKKQAEDKIAEMARLEEEAHAAAGQDDWERAVACVEQLRRDDPANQSYPELLATFHERREKAAWIAVLAAVDQALEQHQHPAARDAVEQFQTSFPRGHYRQEAEEVLSHIKQLREQWVWDATERDADDCLAKGELDKAAWIYRGFIKSAPGHEQADYARQKAEELEEAWARRQDDEVWRATLAKAAQFEAAERFETAAELLDEFIEGYPESRHLTEAKIMQAQCMERLQAAMAKIRAQAAILLERGDLGALRLLLEKARDHAGEHPDTIDLRAKLKKRDDAASLARTEATRLAGQGHYPDAVKCMEEACGHDATNPELIAMRSNYRALLEQQQERALAARRRRKMMVVSTVTAIILAVVAFYANQIYWEHRFERAVKGRDLEAAEAIASRLPARSTSIGLELLRTYTIERDLVLEKMDESRVVMARFESGLETALTDLLEAAGQRETLSDALRDLSAAREKIAHFFEKYEEITVMDGALKRRMAQLAERHAARVLPVEWAALNQAMAAAMTNRVLSEADTAYRVTGEQVGMLEEAIQAPSLRYEAMEQALVSAGQQARQLNQHGMIDKVRQEVEDHIGAFDQLKQSCETTLDFEDALKRVDAWQAVASNQWAALNKMSDFFKRVEVSRASAEKAEAPRLMAKPWMATESLQEALDDGHAITGLVSRLTDLDERYGKMAGESARLAKEESALKRRLGELDRRMAEMKQHDKADCAVGDFDEWARRKKEAELLIIPASFAEADQKINELAQASADMERKLDRLSYHAVVIAQMTGNLADDLVLLAGADPVLENNYTAALASLFSGNSIDECLQQAEEVKQRINEAIDKIEWSRKTPEPKPMIRN